MALHRKDSDIQQDIMKELKWDPQVEETDVGVIVKDGAVTLTGTMPTYSSKMAAKRAAKKIRGVRAVADEIKVKIPSQMIGSDEDIAHHIAQFLDWNVQIPSDAVKAEVRDGTVTLTGNVDWHYQSESVKKRIEDMRGVKHVINSILVRKRASLYNVKHEIEDALRRHADVEAERIKISVLDGTVTLDGTVESFPERDLIEDSVWAAEGVTKVVDNLRVA